MMTGNGWGAVLPEAPELDTRGFATIEGKDYLELSENGWGAVIAAVAGSEKVRRVPLRLSEYTVRTSWEHEGEHRTEVRERNAEDQESIDEAVEEYLADAGLPARPRGCRWFLAVPPGVADAPGFWRTVNRRFDELTGRQPDGWDTARALAVVMHELYRTA